MIAIDSLRVIDLYTGEDKTEGKRIVDIRQAAAYRYIKEREGRQPDFTFTDMDSITEVIENIDDKHCGYLLYLQCFIDYRGKLVKSDRAKTVMTKKDVQETVGLKRTAFSEFFKAMTENGIIYESDGAFYVNERYHFRGKTSNTRVIKSFTNKVREMYKGSSAKKLGFVYKLLPFIHLETNTICTNPYETDIDRIAQLSKSDIAELTGEDERNIYRKIRGMKLGDEYVFAEVVSGNTRYYKINPFIFYRKTGEPDATLREMFRKGFGR